MLYQLDKSEASNTKTLLTSLHSLVRKSVVIANFKTYNNRKNIHSHLFLLKNYSGESTISVFNPHTEAEVLSLLETGWGIGNVEDLQLSFCMAHRISIRFSD